MGPCYVVFKGKKPKIYMTWHEWNEQVLGFKNAIYKKYNNYDIAVSDFNSSFGAAASPTKLFPGMVVKPSLLILVTMVLGKMLSLSLYSCWCLVFGSGCPCPPNETTGLRLTMTQSKGGLAGSMFLFCVVHFCDLPLPPYQHTPLSCWLPMAELSLFLLVLWTWSQLANS